MRLPLAAIRSAGRRRLAQAATLALGVAVAFVFVAIGLAFLALSLYAALSVRIGAPLAALGTAAAAFLIAFLIIIVARLAARPAKNTKDPVQAKLGEALGQDFARCASSAVREHALAAGIGALALGMLVGASPRCRRLLFGFLRR